MTTYNVAKGGYETNPLDCQRPAQDCIGMEKSDEVVARGGVLRFNMGDICARLKNKHDCKPTNLKVGDILEIFNQPTYSVLESLAIHIDGPLFGMTFDIKDALGQVLTGSHTLKTHTAAVGVVGAPGYVACADSSVLVGNGTPDGIGTGAGDHIGRHTWDFTRQPVPIRSDVANYLQLVITALPVIPATVQPGLMPYQSGMSPSLCDICMTFFVGVRRTAICHDRCPGMFTDCAGCDVCTKTQTS